jgi:hypothetical protein
VQKEHSVSYGLVGLSSKYQENILLGKHQFVWGSYYDREAKKWGFKCCKQLHKEAECKVVIN